MARVGTLALFCATVLFPRFLCAGDDHDAAITASLAVQQALREGTEHMERGHFGSAVHVLESQLARLNGNRVYLGRLRDACRAHIKELRLAGRDTEAQTYIRRLEILEPGARLDLDTVHPAEAKPAPLETKPAPPPPPLPTRPPPTTAEMAAASGIPAPKAIPVVRGIREEDRRAPVEDPFRLDNKVSSPTVTLLNRGQQAWEQRRYETAGRCYEEAHQIDPQCTQGIRDQWAYCKLYVVVQQLQTGATPSYPQLEQEVRTAMSLSSKVEAQGKDLLARILERRGRPEATLPSPASPAQAPRGWAIHETAHFRVHHQGNSELAERAGRIVEQTRVDVSRKWFGDDGVAWTARCEVYLYPTGEDYSRATGKPATWPGHTTMNQEGARVLSRRIDLRCDYPNALVSVLPHETTHATLAGRFGGPDLPRWVDEGIAILSEPPEMVNAHLRTLPQHRQDRLLFSVRDLMTMENYPDPRRVCAFYAQSASLTQYLVRLKGPQIFTSFVSQALRYGYDKALQRHYGFDLQTLDQQWWQVAFRAETVQANGGR